MTQTHTITTWTETIDALRERDTRLNAAAACPLSPFPTVSNGFTLAVSYLYDALRVVEGEKPISHDRESETAETLLASARECARYGIAFTPPGWEDVASVFETLLIA